MRKKIEKYILVLALIGCGVALVQVYATKPMASNIFAKLGNLSVLELPDAAAKIVAGADVSNQVVYACEVINVVNALEKPGVVPFVVDAISRSSPDVAPVVAGYAAAQKPSEVVPITKAAVAAAPAQVRDIVASLCREVPEAYQEIALTASLELPDSRDEVVQAVIEVLPGVHKLLLQALDGKNRGEGRWPDQKTNQRFAMVESAQAIPLSGAYDTNRNPGTGNGNARAMYRKLPASAAPSLFATRGFPNQAPARTTYAAANLNAGNHPPEARNDGGNVNQESEPAKTVEKKLEAVNTFNLSRDFSREKNPNGVWRFGLIQNIGAPLQLSTVRKHMRDKSGLIWDSWGSGSDKDAYLQCAVIPSASPKQKGNTADTKNCVAIVMAPQKPGNKTSFHSVEFVAPRQENYLINVTVSLPAKTKSPVHQTFCMTRNSLVLSKVVVGSEPVAFSKVITASPFDIVAFTVGFENGKGAPPPGVVLQITITPSIGDIAGEADPKFRMETPSVPQSYASKMQEVAITDNKGESTTGSPATAATDKTGLTKDDSTKTTEDKKGDAKSGSSTLTTSGKSDGTTQDSNKTTSKDQVRVSYTVPSTTPTATFPSSTDHRASGSFYGGGFTYDASIMVPVVPGSAKDYTTP